MKKLFAIILAVAMVLALGTSAFAAGSIQISRDNTYDGTTNRVYSAYKIFDADTSLSGSNTQGNKQPRYTEEGPVAYTMATNSPWLSVMQLTDQIWFSVDLSADSSKYVITPNKMPADGVTDANFADGTYYTLANGVYTAATEFEAGATYYRDLNDSDAADIASFLNVNLPTGLEADYSIIAGGSEVPVADGYYLIVANDGAPVLTLVTSSVVIVEKNTYPSIHKTAEEAAYQIGDKVEYTADVTIPANSSITYEYYADEAAYNTANPTATVTFAQYKQAIEDQGIKYVDGGNGYVAKHAPIILHDTMDESLSFINAVYDEDDAPYGYSAVYGETGETTTSAFSAYELAAGTEATNPCTFHITIPVTEDLLGKTITFTYYAEVNSLAQGSDGLINTLKGEYNTYETEEDTPTVYTFDFSFQKVFDEDDDELVATFELQDADGNAIKFIQDATTGDYIVADSKAIAANEAANAEATSEDDIVDLTVITMVNGNLVKFTGLKEATYKLVEKTTSTGYNLLDAPVTVVIEDTTNPGTDGLVQESEISYTVKVDGEDVGDTYQFDVENHQGSVLPSTGGIGTTIFYVIGAILVVGAGVVLVTRRRSSVES